MPKVGVGRVGSARLRVLVASGYRVLSRPGKDAVVMRRWLKRNPRSVSLTQKEFEELLKAADELLRVRRVTGAV